jgi:hypothetical protein
MHFRHLVSAIALGLAVAAANAAAPPTSASVGDANSFGRGLIWLGLLDTEIDLLSDCTGLPAETQNRCVVAAAAPAATSFSYLDLNRITLPAQSTHSLLCQWFTPQVTIQFSNPTASPISASVNWVPSLTVESSVLSNPALIDKSTGQPFNGQLTAWLMGGGYNETFTLAAGDSRSVTNSVSRVCVAGSLDKQNLMQNYGLNAAQAQEVFNHDMTIHLNISGSVTGTSAAYLYFGLRFVGD